MDYFMIAVLLAWILAGLCGWIKISVDHRHSGSDDLKAYMWSRDAKRFFGVTDIRQSNDSSAMFDDCLEEESARLVSSRVL